MPDSICSLISTNVKFIVQICILMATVVNAALPQAPSNIRILQVFSRTAVVTWTHSTTTGSTSQIRVGYFEMTVLPYYNNTRNVNSRPFRLVTYLQPDVRLKTVNQLLPDTYYIIYMRAFNDEGSSNSSSNATFLTLSDRESSEQFLRAFRIGDFAVVLIIVVIWCVAVTIFLQKWGSIRIVQPREPRYSFKPKNLETIRVCKRPTDSVIYKTYSRQLSFTMEKREQKLERMNTLRSIEALQIEEEKKAAKQSGARPKRDLHKNDSCSQLVSCKPTLEMMQEEETHKDEVKVETEA
ncbi:uncharacterized protein LOC141908870 [Tubulanus polymorphus]|uniref:uncharacterized protein LOC141908870 n=1 Tax=Tubulanus polymorphus TaxID=672921 RepID=UPI003DA21B7C